MRAAWVALVLASCYSPRFQSGAPCDPTNPSCPDGQTCIASGGGYACEPPGTQSGDAPSPPRDQGPIIDAYEPDAHPDGHVTATDMDGDGVPDSMDNCPTVYNPLQENEDNDKYGDACDPCPPYPDTDPPMDTDHDGVSDLCDPSNATNDKIAWFEGFHHGVPTNGWYSTGTWAAGSDDDVTADDTAAGSGATLTIPIPAMYSDEEETVTEKLVLNAVAASGFRGAGVVDDYDHTIPAGIACQLNIGTNGKVNMFDVEPGTQLGSAAFTITTGDAFVLRLTRAMTSFTCGANDVTNATSITPFTETSATSVTTPEVGIRIHSTAVAVKWLLVVTH